MGVDSGISHLRLTETLLELHRARRSCVVRLERGASKKQLFISQGDLSFAESNVAEEHLAHVLIRLDYLSKKDLQKVSLLMRGGKSSDDAIVLATGFKDFDPRVAPEYGCGKLDNVITSSKFFSTAANREVKVRGDWNGTNFVAEEVEFDN